jgi:hypothetical protein
LVNDVTTARAAAIFHGSMQCHSTDIVFQSARTMYEMQEKGETSQLILLRSMSKDSSKIIYIYGVLFLSFRLICPIIGLLSSSILSHACSTCLGNACFSAAASSAQYYQSFYASGLGFFSLQIKGLYPATR